MSKLITPLNTAIPTKARLQRFKAPSSSVLSVLFGFFDTIPRRQPH